MDGIIERWLVGRNDFLSPLPHQPGLKMNLDARRSYFSFSLAVKKDEVITVLEWQLGSEVEEGSSVLGFHPDQRAHRLS